MRILVMESGSLEPGEIKPPSIPMAGIAKVDSLRKVHAITGGAVKASYQLYRHFAGQKGNNVEVFADLSTVSPGMHRVRGSRELLGREYDVILMNSLRDVLVVSGYVRRHKGVRTIYTDRGNAMVNYAKAAPHKKLTPWMAAAGYLLRDMRGWLTAYVAITEQQEDFAKKFFDPRTKIRYIPIAPDPEYKALRKRKTFEGAVYVGRLDERQKKVSFLLHGIAAAIKRHPGLMGKELLRVYGEGPDAESYKSLAARLGIAGHVKFLGFKRGKALVDAYNNAGFLALTSDWESPGRVLLESMACGTPVLINERINAKMGKARLVASGENGMLYAYGDVDDFADKFYALYSEKKLRDRLARNAAKSSGRFSLDHAMIEYDRIVKE